MSVKIYDKLLIYCSDSMLEKALEDIRFELAEREMKKIEEEERQK
jgi:hypothetical protein